MSSNTTVTSTGRNNNKPIANRSYFLAHELEPIDTYKTFTDDEIRQELYENRFFLKRRVWQNMQKIRRSPQMRYSSPALELNDLRPRLVG